MSVLSILFGIGTPPTNVSSGAVELGQTNDEWHVAAWRHAYDLAEKRLDLHGVHVDAVVLRHVELRILDASVARAHPAVHILSGRLFRRFEEDVQDDCTPRRQRFLRDLAVPDVRTDISVAADAFGPRRHDRDLVLREDHGVEPLQVPDG